MVELCCFQAKNERIWRKSLKKKLTNSNQCTIQLLPTDRVISIEKGGNLLKALYKQNIFLRTDCWGPGYLWKMSDIRREQRRAARKMQFLHRNC
jgi:hypothetical protein